MNDVETRLDFDVRRSLMQFCMLYFPDDCHTWGPGQTQICAALEKATLEDVRANLYRRRGQGASTLAVRAAIWAQYFRLRKRIVVCAETIDHANDLRADYEFTRDNHRALASLKMQLPGDSVVLFQGIHQRMRTAWGVDELAIIDAPMPFDVQRSVAMSERHKASIRMIRLRVASSVNLICTDA